MGWLQAACGARLIGTKKMLRPMSSPKTGSIWARETSVRPVAWIWLAAGNAEAGVALEIGLEEVAGDAKAGEGRGARPECQSHARDGASRTATSGWARHRRCPDLGVGDRRHQGPAFRAACRVRQCRFGAHLAACAGSEIPLALHPLDEGPGCGTALIHHRASRESRQISTYSAGVDVAIPHGRQGEPFGYDGI